jgi:Carboxypeptidase regulatory-like domain
MFALRHATLGLSFWCATVAHAQLATAVGIVVDSIRGRPLAGATIVISDAPKQGMTDATGKFRVDSIPPGAHILSVFHPWLDAIGVSLTTSKITFAPGGMMGVLLATPSAMTWVSRRCSAADLKTGPGAVTGRVLQLTTDDPAPGAFVHYAALMYEAGKDIGLRHTTITRDATVTPTGDFIICGVPVGVAGTIRATRGRASTGELPADLTSQSIVAFTLRLAPDDTLATHREVLTGRVVDTQGAPIAAARVMVVGTSAMTQTSDSGAFSLRDIPLGSQAVDVRKAGLPRIDTIVTVIAAQSVTVTVPTAAATTAVRLVAVGFERRRQAGVGTFITADTIAHRKARYIADLQPLMPGLATVTTSRGAVLVPPRTGNAHCLLYLIDGQAHSFYDPGQINEEFPASNVIGLEYYAPGTVPKELFDQLRVPDMETPAHCYMIAIWSSTPAGAN